MASEHEYPVMLRHPSDLEVDRLSSALIESNDWTLLDATKFVRQCGGFLGTFGTEPEALDFASRLSGKGIEVLVRREEDLRDLPAAMELQALEIDEGTGNLLLRSRDASENLPAHALRLLAAARFERFHSEKKEESAGSAAGMAKDAAVLLATGGLSALLPKKGSKKKSTTTLKAEFYYLADLFFLDLGVRYRLNPEGFDYSCLGEEKTLHGLSNFRLLLSRLTELGNVQVNRGARLLVESQPLNLMPYDTEEVYERENLWLYQLIE